MTEMPDLSELSQRAGVEFFDHQLEAFAGAHDLGPSGRLCLYFPTGKGKTLTSLVCVAQTGYMRALVIAPPATHDGWQAMARRLGMEVEVMSHAKFRMKETKLRKDWPVIADEFHLFGGHGGKGWIKFDTMARYLKAPVVIASATPNYNDAERVYCIQHVIAPQTCKGGYLEFLYAHCNTKQNQFGMTPLVDDVRPFKAFVTAADYLAALPNVFYIPDTLTYTIADIDVSYPLPDEFTRYGVDRRRQRIIASQIEEKHAKINHQLIGDDGLIRDHVYDELTQLVGQANTPVLMFCNHSTVGQALSRALVAYGVEHAYVDGTTSKAWKLATLEQFRQGSVDILIGTSTLATGADGLDKVCDLLVIVDDTEDDSLRRQLIGRIMPRGSDTDASKKVVARLTLGV